jgi:hypothetical protein
LASAEPPQAAMVRASTPASAGARTDRARPVERWFRIADLLWIEAWWVLSGDCRQCPDRDAGRLKVWFGTAPAAARALRLHSVAMPVPPPTAPRPGRIRQGDREKALRPLPIEARRAAFDAGLAAYEHGDFFAAHEALEPAWMGSDDLGERALHQGLIKLAAAYVHAVRRNPAGIAKNLAGARHHLALAGPAGRAWGVDVADLLAAIDARLERPEDAADPPVIRRLAPA